MSRKGLVGVVLVAAAVVALAAPAAAATPPGRPATGFGSTEGYVSTGATEYSTGSAVSGSQVWWWIPSTLRNGTTAPVVVFLHGFSLITPDPYQAHIEHLTRQGYIVVYPQFNLGAGGILFDNNQNTMLSRAIAATDTALGRIGAAADRSRIHLYGHSLGGLLASVWTARGGVAPASVTLANPSTSNGAPIPVTEVPWRTLAPSTTAPVIAITGTDDTIAAPSEATGLVQTMTAARSRIVYQARTDTYGDPDLVADHMAPIDDDGIIPSWLMDFFGGDGEVDAMDHRVYEAALDAAIAGNRTVPFAMGTWSDGRAVLAPTVLWSDIPTAPSAPTAVTATPGDRQVTVDWGAPASTGGRAVTGYRVFRDGALVAEPGAAARSTVVTGLTNGTTYAFTVRAVNSEGESAAGGPAGATPRTVPGPPVGLAAAPGDGAVTLSWSPPATDGGSPLTAYRVYRGATLLTEVGPGTTTVTDGGRANGTEYAYTVTAVTAGGESTPAGPVAATPRTVPGAPTALTAVPGDGSVTVSWAPPADSGGSPVTGYRLYRDAALVEEVDAATISVTDVGLVNGTAHAYTVTALTAGGESAPAGPAAATPRTVPGAPTGLTVTPGPGDTLELAWSPPADDGGAPVTAYEVRRDGSTVATVATPGWTDPAPGVGVTHEYEVRARNVAGDSPAAGPVAGRVDHHQPDVHLRRAADATWAGEDVHTADGTGQARTAATRRGATSRFVVRVTDDGTATDTFTLRSPAGTTAFRTRYVDVATGTDVTAAVVAGTLVVDDGTLLRIEVRVGAGVAVGRTRTVLLTATATADPTAVDGVRATVRVTA